MRCTFSAIALAAFASFAVAAPLQERGGYYNADGQWVDDGYWAWSHGDKSTPFVPWAGSSQSSGSGSSNNGGSSSGGSGYMGTGTYFYQNGNAGACGNANSDSAYIVALQTSMYSGGSHCGQSVYITNTNNGQTITATVADECPSCGSSTDLDLSTGAFHGLGGSDSAGTISLSWHF